MIKITAENGHVEQELEGTGMDILCEASTIAHTLYNGLKNGSVIVGELFKESLKDDAFWALNPFGNKPEEEQNEDVKEDETV